MSETYRHFFVKALYDMRESVILGMDQRRKPQEKEGTKQMKFDMHCHTKEGSMDGKVPIDDFIAELIRKGFNGMLVSDHNSYNGYRTWKRNIKDQKFKDFVVLKGIEYERWNIRAGTSLRREIFKLHQYPEEAESDGGDESV